MAANNQSVGCLLRLFWIAAGYLALLLIAPQIAKSARFLSGFDLAYWLVVLLIVGARYADARYFAGVDGFGEPTTNSDLRRHTIKVVLLAGLIWLALHVFAALGL